ERQASRPAGVCGLAAEEPLPVEVPHAEEDILAAADRVAAVGTEPGTADGMTGRWQVSEPVALEVPQAQPRVGPLALAAAREQSFAVGRERQRPHRVVVAAEDAHLLLGDHVPEPDCLVRATGEEELAVGREEDGVDGGRVTAESAQQLATLDVPE